MRYYAYREHEEHRTDSLPAAYYRVDENNPRYEMIHHWHKEYELIYISKGSIKVTLGDKSYPLKSGDFLFINSGVVHSGIPDACTYECIVFKPETAIKQYLSRNSQGKALLAQELVVPPMIFNTDNTLKGHAQRLIIAMREKGAGFDLEVLSCIAGIFGRLLKKELPQKSMAGIGNFAERLLPFENAVSFIEENFSKPITLAQMAAKAGMSRKYFNEYFKKISGKSPFEYLNCYRVEQASELLLHTDMPITAIALDCGFNDLSYFIKTFKKQKETTPGRYRGQNK